MNAASPENPRVDIPLSGEVPGRVDVPVSGGSLATFRYGDGQPVLAVHGITSSSHAWPAVARSLAGRVSLLAPDLRGRARSAALGQPYGVAAHVRDMLSALDRFGLDRAVLIGHSLGAYIIARLAADHPERVAAVVLIDGGLSIPRPENVDPQQFIDEFLGPTLARLKMTFPSHEEYHAWWRKHPAFGRGDIEDSDLIAYADHDLVGTAPSLRSSVVEEAVRGDAEDLFTTRDAARRLTVPATLMCAPRGLLDEANPMQPLSLAEEWAAEAPGQRRVIPVPDVNHFTIVLGRDGAKNVAEVVAEAVAGAPTTA